MWIPIGWSAESGSRIRWKTCVTVSEKSPLLTYAALLGDLKIPDDGRHQVKMPGMMYS